MGLFNKQKPQPYQPTEHKEQIQAYCFLREDEKLEVIRLNPDFDLSTAELVEKGIDRVYRFEKTHKFGVQLVPDNENEHDKNAVAIHINGKFFGYVQREAAPVMRHVLKNGRFDEIRLVISGGPALYVYNGKATARCYDFECQLYVTYTV